jgi:hypothetical protein
MRHLTFPRNGSSAKAERPLLELKLIVRRESLGKRKQSRRRGIVSAEHAQLDIIPVHEISTRFKAPVCPYY